MEVEKQSRRRVYANWARDYADAMGRELEQRLPKSDATQINVELRKVGKESARRAGSLLGIKDEINAAGVAIWEREKQKTENGASDGKA